MPTLQFKGKPFVQNHHLTVKYHELVPVKSKSVTGKVSLNDNLIIHGDNLKVLKSLLPTYAGKIKCIYIDPPYNTGNEKWVYNDNVNSPMMQEWLGKTVDRDDLTRHDKWLCMMMPRLKILRDLLHVDEGLIFVSIDDNELNALRLLMDKIFGAENWFATLTRRAMHTVRNSSKDFNLNTDYVLVYGKNKLWHGASKDRYIRIPMDKTGAYPLDDNDGKGAYKLDPISARNFYTPYEYTFKNGLVWTAPAGSYPRYSEETLAEMEEAEEIVFTGKEPKAKRYLKDVQEGRPPDALLVPEDVAFNSSGTTMLRQILGGGKFAQPKPIELIQYILQMVRDKNAIVLDSFAGSATTAHAVLSLNRKDGDKRQFILVQCDELNKKSGKIEDICNDVTAERVRCVIRGVPKAKDDNLRKGLGGSFSYYELGKPIDSERILTGKDLPSFAEMARYVFYTATGEEFNEKKINGKTGFIGESREYLVYLLYKPDLEYLKSTALTLERAEELGKFTGKKRLVFAPSKYLDEEHCERLHIDFAQLPFEIYRKQ